MRFAGFNQDRLRASMVPDMDHLDLEVHAALNDRVVCVGTALQLIDDHLDLWRGQSLVAQEAVIDLLLDLRTALTMEEE